MKENHPDRKVGLVTFTDYIEIIGDGTQASNTIRGKELDDYNFLLKNATTGASNLLSKEIGKTHDDLARRVQALRATNSTALGPGMISAIGLASLGALGSQVIVCTDGEANMGIGSYKSTEVYKPMGEFAKEKGVTVHIVTFKGTECNIDAISAVSGMTNGEIERVDTNEIGENFRGFLSKPVLATKVELRVKLH